MPQQLQEALLTSLALHNAMRNWLPGMAVWVQFEGLDPGQQILSEPLAPVSEDAKYRQYRSLGSWSAFSSPFVARV